MPPTKPNIIAVSAAGSLYTTSFIPKFIDKSAASFALLDNGMVQVYNGRGEVALESPASSVVVKTHGNLVNNKVDLNIQGTDYIFRVDLRGASALAPISGIIGDTRTMKDANEFFALLSQSTVPVIPQTRTVSPLVVPAPVFSSTGPSMTSSGPATVLANAPTPVTTNLRKRANSYITTGIIFLAIGIILTIGSYLTSTNDSFFIFWPAALIGVVFLVRGIVSKNKIA